MNGKCKITLEWENGTKKTFDTYGTNCTLGKDFKPEKTTDNPSSVKIGSSMILIHGWMETKKEE